MLLRNAVTAQLRSQVAVSFSGSGNGVFKSMPVCLNDNNFSKCGTDLTGALNSVGGRRKFHQSCSVCGTGKFYESHPQGEYRNKKVIADAERVRNFAIWQRQ